MNRNATIGAVVVALVSIVQIARTWGGWTDPLIDFGRELYVAWQVSEGAALYRDVAYFNGPFSPHLNALVFRVASPGIATLAIVNIAVYFGIALLSYDLLRRAGDAFSAAAAGVTLATLFGFIQLVGVGNYNYATPYAHEMTHGLLLSLAAIWCLSRLATTGRRRFAVCCGAAGGMVFLTKPEMFLACAPAIAAGIPALRADRPRNALVIAASGVVVVAAAAGFLWLRTDLATASRGVLGGWVYVLDAEVRALPFYRAIAGLDQPAEQARQMIVMSLAWAMLLALGCGLAALARGALRAVIVTSAALVPPAAAWMFFDDIAWQAIFYPLPAATIVLAIVATVTIARRGTDESRLIRLTFCVFAAALLAKMILRPVVSHYGFVLAMPATLAVVAAATGWIPGSLKVRLGPAPAGALRVFAVAVIATIVTAHLWAFQRLYASKPVFVGGGRDRIRAADDGRGEAVDAMVWAIERYTPAGSTLAVIPEGAMLNSLSRRRNPTPYVTLLPPEFAMFGAGEILEAYRRRPPDFVVIAPRDLTEYGSTGFDRDYGSAFGAWLHEAYEAVQTAQPAGYRLTLLARRGVPATTGPAKDP